MWRCAERNNIYQRSVVAAAAASNWIKCDQPNEQKMAEETWTHREDNWFVSLVATVASFLTAIVRLDRNFFCKVNVFMFYDISERFRFFISGFLCSNELGALPKYLDPCFYWDKFQVFFRNWFDLMTLWWRCYLFQRLRKEELYLKLKKDYDHS